MCLPAGGVKRAEAGARDGGGAQDKGGRRRLRRWGDEEGRDEVVEETANASVAMATTITGAVEDHMLIMDMLEDYIFPMGERKIAEFMVTGVSLGGMFSYSSCFLPADSRTRGLATHEGW